MDIDDPRDGVTVSVGDGVLKQESGDKLKQINLSDSLEVSQLEHTSYAHMSPMTSLMLSVTPLFLFMVFGIGAAFSSPGYLALFVLFGAVGGGLLLNAVYRHFYPEYTYEGFGVVFVKSDGVEISLVTEDASETRNNLAVE